MKTIVRKIDKNQIDEDVIREAGEVLKNGGLVAFPTETVYGLGADALKEEAAKKTYEAKGRPSDNPLIVHIAEYEDLKQIAVNIPPETDALAAHFWPGPLTMIFDPGSRRFCFRTECEYIRKAEPDDSRARDGRSGRKDRYGDRRWKRGYRSGVHDPRYDGRASDDPAARGDHCGYV